MLLAHGAGADMNAAALTTVADALADARIPSLRFDFPYRRAGRRAPDRPPVLEAAVREAVAELARRAQLPVERLVLGGRSMGGRICSLVAGDEADPVPALGLAMLGYPLHPPGKPETLRVEHFQASDDAGAVREWHARRVRDARRAEAARQEGEGAGDVPLGRDRRPRLQATESERADAPLTRSRGVAEAVVAFVQSLT